MRYRLLGKSGLRVSELCLGTMTFGDSWGWGADKPTSQAIFEAFADAGGNFVDTAYVYTDGLSEQYVGEFIASDRDHFVVGTKYSSSLDGDVSKAGNSRKNMMRSVETSLRRLSTDHIDLLWLHTWDATTPIDEILRGLDDLVRAGKVLYIGISDAPAWQISRGSMLADLRGWSPIVAIQVKYNLVDRTAERDLLPMARELGLGVTAWSPLGGGLLAGKYQATTAEAKYRLNGKLISARELEIADSLVKLASELDCTPSQLALATLLHGCRSTVFPILGARTVEQIEDNLGCVDVVPTAKALEALDDLTTFELGFPHDLLASEIDERFTFTGRNSPLTTETQTASYGKECNVY
jgi:aryl-alcohol dehydrogenase-like predicted oxidoreductase